MSGGLVTLLLGVVAVVFACLLAAMASQGGEP